MIHQIGTLGWQLTKADLDECLRQGEIYGYPLIYRSYVVIYIMEDVYEIWFLTAPELGENTDP